MSPIPDLDNLFDHHPPTPGQVEKYTALRNMAKALAHGIVELVPYSAERSTSLSRLRESLMWANAGIACNSETPAAPHKEPDLIPGAVRHTPKPS